MGLDYKLILDELDKLASRFERHFDSLEAKLSKFPSVGAPEAKEDSARETSEGVTADNWGGLFDGGDDLDTVVSNTASAESVGLHDVPVPIQSAVFGAGVFSDNWGGLFDGGDDLDATVSNSASAESVGFHDVPACDPASFDLNTVVSNTISIKLVSSDGTKRSVDRPLAASEALANQVPEERFAEEVDLYDFPCDDNDQAPPHRVNLDAPPFVLSLDVAEVGAKVFPSAGRKRSCELIEGGLAASRPRRAPPRPPRVRRLRRALPRLPQSRRPRRARLRVRQLRRPWRAPSPATSTSSAAAAKTAQPGCRSGDVRELVTISTATPVIMSAFEDIPKHLKPVLVTSMAISAKLPSTSMTALVVFEEMQQRYITNLAPAVIGSSSACFVYLPLLDSAIEMSEGMISQGTVMLLDQLPAHEFDKQQWPSPLVDCNTLLIGTSQGGLSFCSPMGFYSATAQRKPPWPTPLIQFEVTDGVVQLRTIPWPSFWECAIQLHCVNLLPMVFVHSATTVQVLGFCEKIWPLNQEFIFKCSHQCPQFFLQDINFSNSSACIPSHSTISTYTDVYWLLNNCQYKPPWYVSTQQSVMERANINSNTHVLSVSISQFGAAIYKVLEKMSDQNSVLEPVHITVGDIDPWPLPLKSKNTLFSVTARSYGTLGLSFCYDQDDVKQRPPWPPPIPIQFMAQNCHERGSSLDFGITYEAAVCISNQSSQSQRGEQVYGSFSLRGRGYVVRCWVSNF